MNGSRYYRSVKFQKYIVVMFMWPFDFDTPLSKELKSHETVACIFRPQNFILSSPWFWKWILQEEIMLFLVEWVTIHQARYQSMILGPQFCKFCRARNRSNYCKYRKACQKFSFNLNWENNHSKFVLSSALFD